MSLYSPHPFLHKVSRGKNSSTEERAVQSCYKEWTASALNHSNRGWKSKALLMPLQKEVLIRLNLWDAWTPNSLLPTRLLWGVVIVAWPVKIHKPLWRAQLYCHLRRGWREASSIFQVSLHSPSVIHAPVLIPHISEKYCQTYFTTCKSSFPPCCTYWWGSDINPSGLDFQCRGCT